MPLHALLPRLLLLALIACTLRAAPVQAQVRRCVSPTGELIYTDRQCNEIGATERALGAPIAGSASSAYRGGCARRLSDLVYGVTGAIEARDVNRLALFYDWAGMSTRQGYAVMAQLDGIVHRPLVDVLPVYSPSPPILAADGSVADANADGYFPQTAVRRAPVGLRLEQTFSNGVTPSRTVLGLRKRLGCWWVHL
jgi:hypothetical protein